MTNEIVAIKGYEGIYGITRDGKLWSYPRTVTTPKRGSRKLKGKWLKLFKRGNKGFEYLTVELNKKANSIHRLVAQTFIPNPNNYLEVNHKDGNKLNNNVENLEWCTRLQNIQHANRTGLSRKAYGEQHGMTKVKDAQVREIREKKAKGYRIIDLAKEYNTCRSNISYICRNETRRKGNF